MVILVAGSFVNILLRRSCNSGLGLTLGGNCRRENKRYVRMQRGSRWQSRAVRYATAAPREQLAQQHDTHLVIYIQDSCYHELQL